MTCKWLTVFLSDLNYNATRCKHNILCVESKVIDDSTTKIILTCPVIRKVKYV